jgi:hypothetical protein
LFAIASTAAAGQRLIETANYRIHTDLEADLSADLARRMEAMYDQYARRFADFSRGAQSDPMEVYLFARRDDYIRFTNDRFPNTGGVFMPRRKLLAAFLEGQGRDGIRKTLQHEAFHQFAFRAFGPGLPIWLNEGLAQVFEEGLWTGSTFMIGQVPPRRVRQLQHDMRDRRLMEFSKFLSMSDDQWSQNLQDRNVGAAQYNQAWAMAHFLVFATDESGEPRFRARLIHMLKLIRGDAGGQEAFMTAFSDNIPGFQDRFVEYARQLLPTQEALCMENQFVLADMLTTLKSQGLNFDDMKAFRKTVVENSYRLQYSRGPVQWSTAEDPKAYFTDVLGREMQSDQLHFVARRGAPLPDMVCRPMSGMRLQTRFYYGGEKIEHETLIEGG